MKRDPLTRRDFLARSAASVAVGAGGLGLIGWLHSCSGGTPARGKGFVPEQLVSGYTSGILRPPGALEEHPFVSRCIKCMKCGQACPLAAVRFLGVQWGRSFGTPVVVPGIRACDLCVRRDRKECITACPTGALQEIALNDVAMGKAEVDKDICFEHQNVAFYGEAEAKERNKNKPERVCAICHKYCPVRVETEIKLSPTSNRVRFKSPFVSKKERETLTKIVTQRAIEVDDHDRPTVVEDRCVGCGRCEEKCPQPDKAIRVETKREILV